VIRRGVVIIVALVCLLLGAAIGAAVVYVRSDSRSGIAHIRCTVVTCPEEEIFICDHTNSVAVEVTDDRGHTSLEKC
jgi:hypothetical protein